MRKQTIQFAEELFLKAWNPGRDPAELAQHALNAALAFGYGCRSHP